MRVLRGWLPRESAAPGLQEGARDGVQPGPPVFAVGLVAWRSAGSEDGGRGEGGECVRWVCKGVGACVRACARSHMQKRDTLREGLTNNVSK